jgi:hypothetical protein
LAQLIVRETGTWQFRNGFQCTGFMRQTLFDIGNNLVNLTIDQRLDT